MDRDTLDKKYGGSERGEGGVERKEEKEEEEEEERERRRTFCFGDVSTYSTTTSPKIWNFSFFVTQQSKKVVRYSSSHISSIVCIDSFEKGKYPKKNAPTISSIATRCHKDSV